MTAADLNPTERFSSRVEDYVRYRPGYPAAVVETLASALGLSANSIVADVGAGTGIFTKLLLDTGARVYGVEPNAPMREAAVQYLAGYERYTPVAASAEATTLPDQSVDMVTAAQAGHWFNLGQARTEFRRILKPGGAAAFIWNERPEGAPFNAAYDTLLQTYGTDYKAVSRIALDFDAFFGKGRYTMHRFPNAQHLDRAGLLGRLQSASYMPREGEPGFAVMCAAADRAFDAYNDNGAVTLTYETTLFYGAV